TGGVSEREPRPHVRAAGAGRGCVDGRPRPGAGVATGSFVHLLPDVRGGHETLGESVTWSGEARAGARGAPVRDDLGTARGRRLHAVRGIQLRATRTHVPP